MKIEDKNWLYKMYRQVADHLRPQIGDTEPETPADWSYSLVPSPHRLLRHGVCLLSTMQYQYFPVPFSLEAAVETCSVPHQKLHRL